LLDESSLVVVLLLASACTGSGGCTWVLWGRDSTADVWAPPDAFASEAVCRRGLLDLRDDLHRRVREQRRPDLARQDYFECWPDTHRPARAEGEVIAWWNSTREADVFAPLWRQ
jgi:hypothetical protein